jgi:tetratricopeptide (TPR) repeat protein
MAFDPILFKSMCEAGDAGQWALKKVLCEKILAGAPKHVPTLLLYADCLTKLGLYELASQVLDHAFSVASKKLRDAVYSYRGHLFFRMGNLAEAETSFLKAHQLNPDDAGFLIFAGVTASRRGDIQQAEAYARKALLCPEGCMDEALANLGWYLVIQQRYSEARTCYLRALEITPDCKRSLFRLNELDLLEAYFAKQKANDGAPA